MIQLIIGNKGKGKTKVILDKVNAEVQDKSGNVVYLDKNTQHMFELNNKVRLIDVSEYAIANADQFIGFIAGIISQDHDLEDMYLDCFLKIAKVEEQDIIPVINSLEKLGDKYNVNFVISITMDSSCIPEELKDKVIAAL